MKIVVFYKSYQKYGGQEKVVYELTHYLAKKGHNVVVYSYKIKDLPETDRITVKKIHLFVPHGAIRTLLFAFFSYIKAKQLKKKDKNICIFGFGKTFYQDIYRSGGGVHKYYFKRATLKYTSIIGRFFYKVRKYLSLYHWINIFIEYLTFKVNKPKLIIAPSEFVKKQIVDCFGFDKDRIVILRNGVDLNRFKPSDKNIAKREFGVEDSFVFCFVSTNHRLKGLQYLLPAVKMLKADGFDFKLLIAGSGSDKFFLKMVKRLKIEDTVVWLGKVKDIEKVYNASDVLIYPTLFDVSSNVVLEAMACGVVPISSIYNGTSEIIVEGENGFLIYDPTDSDEIKTKMRIAMESDLKRLSEKARLSLLKFPSSSVFSRIENILKEKC